MLGSVQGVYGLVTNLGSLVVRLLFQPFEEAAFLAFSRTAGSSSAGSPWLHCCPPPPSGLPCCLCNSPSGMLMMANELAAC